MKSKENKQLPVDRAFQSFMQEALNGPDKKEFSCHLLQPCTKTAGTARLHLD
ncbi:MAG: hypothetical protein U5K84_11070 [Alkalibacterium sp.]|nr:hypothetical protein [Alkalibacterium sp.]